jgi:hypothetical protein
METPSYKRQKVTKIGQTNTQHVQSQYCIRAKTKNVIPIDH